MNFYDQFIYLHELLFYLLILSVLSLPRPASSGHNSSLLRGAYDC